MEPKTVFISCSGEFGCKIGQALTDFLDANFARRYPGHLVVFIYKYASGIWTEEMIKHLKDASYCIFIVTPELMDSDWCLFELGGSIAVNGLYKAKDAKSDNESDKESTNSIFENNSEKTMSNPSPVEKFVLPVYFSQEIDIDKTPFNILELKRYDEEIGGDYMEHKVGILKDCFKRILIGCFSHNPYLLTSLVSVLDNKYLDFVKTIEGIISENIKFTDKYVRRYKLQDQVSQLQKQLSQSEGEVRSLKSKLTYPCVDLGTEVLWASSNFGNGCYFRWDDNINSIFNGDWRLPTKKDFEDLIDVCDAEWVEDYDHTGLSGVVFTNKETRQKIFFPAAGCKRPTVLSDEKSRGYYWTSSKDSLSKACCLRISNIEGQRVSIGSCEISEGLSIRAVLPK